MSFELIQKPAFTADFVLLQKGDQKKIPHALEAIRRDPFGSRCERVLRERYKNLYRYRVGDYRILYAVGTGCVALLGIRDRQDVYKYFHGDPSAAVGSEVDFATAELQEFKTALEDPIPERLPDGRGAAETEESRGDAKPRSEEFLRGLLSFWGVPDEHHERILTCSNAEELFELDLPNEVLEKVLHLHEPPTVEQIAEQPTLELPSFEDLERYAEGTLSGFLLRLDPEQRRAVDRGSTGPLLVRGGPGTGKSIVALYRIRNLFTHQAQEELFGGEPPRVLFVTYTRALTNASAQLLRVLLDDDGLRGVEVRTLDSIANKLVRGGEYSGRASGRRLVDTALQAKLKTKFSGGVLERRAMKRAIDKLDSPYLADEFEWVIDGRSLENDGEYLGVSRTGRGIGLDKRSREAVWGVYKTWRRLLAGQQCMTYTQVQREALARAATLTDSEKYDVVVLDEAQDLKPVGIRLAMALCKSPSGFYLTADSAQSIYGRGFSWRAVSEDLNLKGRSVVLRNNYRCTRQIELAARGLLASCGIEDPESESFAVHEGPKPVCQECEGSEAQVIYSTFSSWAKELRVPVWMSTVLVRNHQVGGELAEELDHLGLPARWVESKDLDIEAKYVKVMTLHASKGLEFPIVAVAGVQEGVFPLARRENQDRDDYAESLNQERRLFHVGMSRAMRRLLVTFPSESPSLFVADLETDLWSWRES